PPPTRSSRQPSPRGAARPTAQPRLLPRMPLRKALKPEMFADSLEHLVRGIVDHADDVSVRSRSTHRGTTLEVRVHPDDLGRVIGRAGRTAKSLRTVMNSLAGRESVRVDLIEG